MLSAMLTVSPGGGLVDPVEQVAREVDVVGCQVGLEMVHRARADERR
jgi:hypothetical protein